MDGDGYHGKDTHPHSLLRFCKTVVHSLLLQGYLAANVERDVQISSSQWYKAICNPFFKLSKKFNNSAANSLAKASG